MTDEELRALLSDLIDDVFAKSTEGARERLAQLIEAAARNAAPEAQHNVAPTWDRCKTEGA